MHGSRSRQRPIWAFALILLFTLTACGGLLAPSITAEKAAIPTFVSPLATWEKYTHPMHKFYIDYPLAWHITEIAPDFGHIGKQVSWWTSAYDPRQCQGDCPFVDEVTPVAIAGQNATRILGHYAGAIGDMGFQQYLMYVFHHGEVYYVFTLFAIDAKGMPGVTMGEVQLLRANDVALFEQMLGTLTFVAG
jgi:hypothetical protein